MLCLRRLWPFEVGLVGTLSSLTFWPPWPPLHDELLDGLMSFMLFVVVAALDDLRPIELSMEVDRKGWRLTLEAAMILMVEASICEVVPTFSYFFSFT